MLGLKLRSRSINMSKLRQKARALDIDTKNMDRSQLIRTIQLTEGNSPCFKTNQGWCKEESCCFRGECLKD